MGIRAFMEGGEAIEAGEAMSGGGGGEVTVGVWSPDGELGRVATMMSSMASGLRGPKGVLAPLLASVRQLSSLRPLPDLPDEV